MYADLHMHTTFSDGSDTPAGLIGLAAAAGLKVIAITDHDCTGGVESVIGSMPANIRLIPGIELSTVSNHRFIHVLGYYIDISNKNFAALLAQTSKAKTVNTKQNFDNAREREGLQYSWNRVLELHRDLPRISGAHVVKAMLKDGYVPQNIGVWELFRKYFLAESPLYIQDETFTAYDAIDAIKSVGGISSIAHPKSVGSDETLSKLIAHGVRGLECFHPTLSKAESKKYSDMAARNGLYVTGGSDWHGADSNRDTPHIGYTGLSHGGYDILNVVR